MNNSSSASVEQINSRENIEYSKFEATESLPNSLKRMSDLHTEVTRYQGEISAIQDEVEKAYQEYLTRTAPLRERASKLRFLVKQTQKDLRRVSEDCGMKIEQLFT